MRKLNLPNHTIPNAYLLILVLLLSTLLNCSTENSGIIRNGFNKTLPGAGTRVLLWGSNSITIEAAKVWLGKVGLVVIISQHTEHIGTDRGLSPAKIPEDQATLFKEAQSAYADYLILAETYITPIMVLQKVDDQPPQEKATHQTVTVKKLGVAIQGINVDTKEVDWSGIAQMPEVLMDVDQTLHSLTWDALGTAWGVLSRRVD